MLSRNDAESQLSVTTGMQSAAEVLQLRKNRIQEINPSHDLFLPWLKCIRSRLHPHTLNSTVFFWLITFLVIWCAFGCPTNLRWESQGLNCDVKPQPEGSVLNQEVCRVLSSYLRHSNPEAVSSQILCATKRSKLMGPLTRFLKHQTTLAFFSKWSWSVITWPKFETSISLCCIGVRICSHVTQVLLLSHVRTAEEGLEMQLKAPKSYKEDFWTFRPRLEILLILISTTQHYMPNITLTIISHFCRM